MQRTNARHVGRPAKIAPGGEELARIAGTMDIHVSFNRYVSRKGDGTESVYVYAWPIGKHGCLRRRLGKLDELRQLSEEALRKTITATFAQNAAKLSLEDRADIVMTRAATTLASKDDDAANKGWGDYT